MSKTNSDIKIRILEIRLRIQTSILNVLWVIIIRTTFMIQACYKLKRISLH